MAAARIAWSCPSRSSLASRDGALKPGPPPHTDAIDELFRAEAELTSKDPELNAAERHGRALEILAKRFDVRSPRYDGNAELLGTAAGIYKRRWQDLGRFDDLKASADFYARGAVGSLGADAYAQINAAFLDDLVAAQGVEPEMRQQRATAIRQRILDNLEPDPTNWWNVASRAEAQVGLGQYAKATLVLREFAGRWRQEGRQPRGSCRRRCDSSDISRTCAASPRCSRAAGVPSHAAPNSPARASSAVIAGRPGSLSGGGPRVVLPSRRPGAARRIGFAAASEVLSCVSGGSIVGACYWLAFGSACARERCGRTTTT